MVFSHQPLFLQQRKPGGWGGSCPGFEISVEGGFAGSYTRIVPFPKTGKWENQEGRPKYFLVTPSLRFPDSRRLTSAPLSGESRA